MKALWPFLWLGERLIRGSAVFFSPNVGLPRERALQDRLSRAYSPTGRARVVVPGVTQWSVTDEQLRLTHVTVGLQDLEHLAPTVHVDGSVTLTAQHSGGLSEDLTVPAERSSEASRFVEVVGEAIEDYPARQERYERRAAVARAELKDHLSERSERYKRLHEIADGLAARRRAT